MGMEVVIGLAGIPAELPTLGAVLVVDTPNSLIERGKLDEGKAVLEKIRGTPNVQAEFEELCEASPLAKEVKHPFRNLLHAQKSTLTCHCHCPSDLPAIHWHQCHHVLRTSLI